MRRFCQVALAALLSVTAVRAQPDTVSSVDPVRLAVVAGVTGGTLVAIHIYQQNAWWKDHRTNFHVREDLTYACNVDKLGHFYASTALTFGFAKSFKWAGFDESSSLIWERSAPRSLRR